MGEGRGSGMKSEVLFKRENLVKRYAWSFELHHLLLSFNSSPNVSSTLIVMDYGVNARPEILAF